MMYHYIKSFLTNLKKYRFFYSINLIGFITGFLLLTIIFTFVHQEFSFDRFHKNADHIYRIHSEGYGVTPLCFAEKLRNKIPEITDVIRFSKTNLIFLNQDEETEIKDIYFTDPETFKVFSFNLVLGDASTALKDPFSIVLDKSTAIKLFENTNILGKTFRDKDGFIYTITGIMDDIPYNSHIQSSAFISIETFLHLKEGRKYDCGSWGHLTYISLSEKSDYKETEVKINQILKDFRMGTKDDKFVLKLQPLKKVYFDSEHNKFDGSKHGNRQTVLIYLVISILILFIVIVNYVNLSIEILGRRAEEIAIRKINGANKTQIILQVLIETFAFAMLAFIVALLFVEFLLPELSSFLNMSISATISRSQLYVCYFVGISFVGLIIGLIPGYTLSKINEIKAFKKESFLSSKSFPRKAMLAFQLTIVAVLLNSSFIINKQIDYILDKDLGFNYEDVVCITLNKDLPDKKEVLKNNLLMNPKIKFVSFSYGLIGNVNSKIMIRKDEAEELCSFYEIDPDYLDLFKIKLKRGRNFSWDLKTDIENKCIVNEEACRIFGLEDPISKKLGGRTIIGVVEDFNFSSLHNKVGPLVLRWGNIDENIVQIKISGKETHETLSYIEKVFKDISHEFNYNYSFLDTQLEDLYRSEINLKKSLTFYSIVAFIIALLGLLGLTLFMVKRMTKEISLRKLFGSSPYHIFKLLVKKQMWILIFSNILAMPISYFVMQTWLDNFPYRVDFDFILFVETFLITSVFILATNVFIVIKTYKVNLISAFKHE